jgi:hypothetical protein
MAQRLNRIERMGESVPASGLRHELCDARSTLWAHSAGVEAALLPDHASEKFNGEAILCRSLFQRPANVVGCARIRGRALRFAWRGLLIGFWMHGGRRDRARLRARLRAYQGESTGKQRSDRSCHVSLAQT